MDKPKRRFSTGNHFYRFFLLCYTVKNENGKKAGPARPQASAPLQNDVSAGKRRRYQENTVIFQDIISKEAIYKGFSRDQKYCVQTASKDKYFLRIAPLEAEWKGKRR